MRSSRAGAQQRTGAATSLPRECHCHWCWCLPSRSRWSCGRLCGLHSLALEHGQQPCWQVHPKQLGSVANSHHCAKGGGSCFGVMYAMQTCSALRDALEGMPT